MRTLDILIPHFNEPERLEQSLSSISNQTWPGTRRVVVADDGSSDLCKKRLHRLCERSSENILILANSENRGRPYTRNVLLDAIDSKYVAWLDAGELWYPEKLQFQFDRIRELDRLGVDTSRTWITCTYDSAWPNEKPKSKKQHVNGEQLKKLLIGSQLRAYLWTILSPSDTYNEIGYFDERLSRLQDLDYFIRFVRLGGSIEVPRTSEPLCFYSKTGHGQDADEVFRCHSLLINKYKATYQRYGRKFLKNRLYNGAALAHRFARHSGNNAEKAIYWMLAARYRPARAFGTTLKKGELK